MKNSIQLTKLSQCAGCAAKVGAGMLSQLLGSVPVPPDANLLVGFSERDDAAVYRLSSDTAIVQTVDFFPPIVDDPFTYGRIAAANALSDIYAMGGEPRFALNMLGISKEMPDEAVRELLRGGYETVLEAGAVVAGGHSIVSAEPLFGLCVTGIVHPDRIVKNTGAQVGDVLLLTKPLGTGVLTTAQKAELLSEDAFSQAVESMTTLNKSARDAMVNYRVHACTDVTGFGLFGHLYEMTGDGTVAARLDANAVQFLPEALDFAENGLLPEGMYRNRSFAAPFVDAGKTPRAVLDLFFDPQTSGGLLICVHPDDADELFSQLSATVPCAQRIGAIVPGNGTIRITL